MFTDEGLKKAFKFFRSLGIIHSQLFILYNHNFSQSLTSFDFTNSRRQGKIYYIAFHILKLFSLVRHFNSLLDP